MIFSEQYCSLTPELKINRLINGLWQVSGNHGQIDSQKAIAAMFDYTTAGLSTWDLADHYDGAADLIRKYRNMINAWGSWQLFQELLTTLKTIADKHNVTVANVAMRYVLEQPTVAGLVVGTRLGITEHIPENLRIFDFELETEAYQQIEAIHEKGNNLMQTIGDCGDEYRNHG